jgi:hypothetical protein
MSALVQASPSSQPAPFVTAWLAHCPVPGSHVSFVHTLPSPQSFGVPGAQVPPWQLSPVVQALPSSHALPSCAGVWAQLPVGESHASWVHTLPSPQSFGVPPVQLPAWQLSPTVQPSPSLHAVPLGMAGWEHAPLAGLHWSWVHGLPSLQSFAAPPVHAPAWQASLSVQASLSSQTVPFATAGFEQVPVPGSQRSWVHAFWSLQLFATPMHVPD